VDATEEKELGKRFKIEGFPTLKFFRGSADAMSDYGGGRTKADIVAWVTKKSAPATVPVSTQAEVTAAVEASEVAFLGLFTAAESPLSKAFSTLASASEAGAFLVAVGPEASALRTAYGVGAGDVVIALNTFEGQANQVVLEEGAPLDAFVSGNSLPHVVAFSQATVSKIFAGAIKTHYLLFADPSAAATYAPLIASFRTLAAGSVGELLFVSVDPKGEGNDKILQYFGVTDANIPTAAIVKMGDAGMKKFMFADAGVAGGDLGEGLGEFLAAFKKGALKPSLKSQPIPAPDATSDVRVLVGKNFDAEVLEGPEKLALVEFYAPWCGHCKSLAPIWEELGTFYKGDSSVGVFKMDATENEVDVPGVNVKGFPTIIGFVKGADGKKNVVEYDGARDLKGFK
jgi:protein disulfide-isomerase A1